MRHVIGQFKATDKYNLSLSVTIIQECILDKCDVVIGHRKIYVDDEDDELIPTEDSQVYFRKSGSTIMKVGRIKTRGF